MYINAYRKQDLKNRFKDIIPGYIRTENAFLCIEIHVFINLFGWPFTSFFFNKSL